MSDTEPRILGLHHVTAITADAQANVDFYTGVLGLRLVKVTVNFDDPSSFHLYYGDRSGRPGTIVTFFAWPGARGGRIGVPQVTTTAFRVAPGSLPAWAGRLASRRVSHAEPVLRLGEHAITAADPDGMRIELIDAADPSPSPEADPLSVERFHGITLSELNIGPTAGFLLDPFGGRPVGESEGRFAMGQGDHLARVDITATPKAPHGTMGAGTVHHVAWRVADDAAQAAWLTALRRAGHQVSPVMDRTYFHSIYFREPGGVLFEIATDDPGFAVDEPPAELGTHLCLPPWLEPQRSTIESSLPQLRVPGGSVIGRR